MFKLELFCNVFKLEAIHSTLTLFCNFYSKLEGEARVRPSWDEPSKVKNAKARFEICNIPCLAQMAET